MSVTKGGRRFIAAVATLLVLGGLLLVGVSAQVGTVLNPGTPVPAAALPDSTPGPTATRPSEARPRSEPVSVRIPKIGAQSSLIGLGLQPDKTVEVPSVNTPMQAGWFRLGPAPGQPGPAVILGHVDGAGKPGIFYRLRELGVGDEILVSTKDGRTVRFVVYRSQQVAKAEFPTDAVYGDTARPELRLITCGGSFDRSAQSYRDNVIAYARIDSA